MTLKAKWFWIAQMAPSKIVRKASIALINVLSLGRCGQ